ncbi:MAG: proline--tRNA ligase [Alphaproteobacteria bacterium]|jgi:prolyl-tRNA synthetase|nr:proline--tRNA ligase [Alphaproteobacteria bacterium]MBT5390530.1 proline--tRNA ligase [Alphaproteobacteria bacterium]MBT5540994.1 proline--tRNA ligase [Alphaproteobacteria bacterium]MBT5654798.1 proline--tRNA ligase [Alphaproteobacteria bacterium]
MKLSKYFLPTLRETPSEAQVMSHRLMLRAGMISQTSAGIYSWLPLGVRVLHKIEQIVREEQDRAGCQEVLMPTLQPADLWKESGRYDSYGKEMLRIKDRHDREMLYGPTNEEVITDIFRKYIKSYKDLPKNLYQIQWKFRDEIRPRFGVMRGREFLMKDNYSFDIDRKGAEASYKNMYEAYLKTFARMGLVAIPVKADPGPIGGDMSQEFQILAKTGESEVFYDKAFEKISGADLDVDHMRTLYAAADDMHDPKNCPVKEEDLLTARGIEVGHIFYFGTKYSEALGATVAGPDGSLVPVEMGSYGIGVSRLVGAIIEANYDDHGIKWPESVAPFTAGIINLKVGDVGTDKMCNDLYAAFQESNLDVLYDDREMQPGAKFSDMDLIGLPWQFIVGPRGLAKGQIELKNRRTGEREELSVESAFSHFTSKIAAYRKSA